jgi:transposase InsO family protein
VKFQFTAEQPNSRWVTDTKAVETAERWQYLAVILHLCLRVAIAQRHPSTKLLHHADRGSECTSDRYQVALRELGIKVSIGDMESNSES